jgi:hypothetical protein
MADSTDALDEQLNLLLRSKKKKSRRKSIAFQNSLRRSSRNLARKPVLGDAQHGFPPKPTEDRIVSQETQLFMTEIEVEDIGELKWGWKWSWLVRAVLERDVLNAFGQVTQGTDRQSVCLKRRVTLFGTVMQSYRIFREANDTKAWIYHFTEEVVEKEPLTPASPRSQRKASLESQPQSPRRLSIRFEHADSSSSLQPTAVSLQCISPAIPLAPSRVPSPELGDRRRSSIAGDDDSETSVPPQKRAQRRKSRRPSLSVEFHGMIQGGLMEQLAVKYNSASAHEDNEMYTVPNLLRRESLQFDGKIMGCLQVIWDVFDEDRQYGITVDEYLTMHKAMFRACYDDSNGDGDEDENNEDEDEDETVWDDGGSKGWSEKLARGDWDKDREGHGCLNFERFKRCWFQMADR